jgi:uncharacterized protein (TIGR00369 family)
VARLSELGIDFDHWCFACGRANPIGLHLEYDVARDRAETRFVPRREHTGYDGLVHGGIVTALLDETMGWAIFHQGIWGVTARITVAFRQPVAVGTALVVTGRVARATRRAIETHGEVRDEAGALLAEADATFLVMPEERRRELERRYSRIDEAFAKVKAAVETEEEKEREKAGT